MNHTLVTHNSIVRLLLQHVASRMDFRNFITLCWMVFAAIMSQSVNRSAMSALVDSKARDARSVLRRMERFINNDRIDMVHALRLWHRFLLSRIPEGVPLVVVMDTSMLFGSLCMIRISVVYARRAIPLVWKTLDHNSASVAFGIYEPLLDELAEHLPEGADFIFLADRGFGCRELLRSLVKRGWRFRIRIKGNLHLHGKNRRSLVPSSVDVQRGWAHLWPSVSFGDVHGLSLAVLDPFGSREKWYIIGDENGIDTNVFAEYAERFCIEEGFLDEKSNGFNLDESRVRAPERIDRTIGVIAVATGILVHTGAEALRRDMRKQLEPRKKRGSSVLKIGWKAFKSLLGKGKEKLEQLKSLLRKAPLDFKTEFEPVYVSKRIDKERARKKHTFGIYIWHSGDNWDDKTIDDLDMLLREL